MVTFTPSLSTSSMVPTSKETLTHLLENELELDSDNIDIDMVGIAGYKEFNAFRVVSYETLATPRDKDKLITTLWQELSYFCMYINTMDPNYNLIMLMIATTWQAVDIILLRLKHVMISAAVSLLYCYKISSLKG